MLFFVVFMVESKPDSGCKVYDYYLRYSEGGADANDAGLLRILIDST